MRWAPRTTTGPFPDDAVNRHQRTCLATIFVDAGEVTMHAGTWTIQLRVLVSCSRDGKTLAATNNMIHRMSLPLPGENMERSA
jgi:hypothetical protein